MLTAADTGLEPNQPAGCFTLRINPSSGRGGGGGSVSVRGRGAGTWTPSWAPHRLVIYHNLTTLVLMLLPSEDESFLTRVIHQQSDFDCCHIILYKAIMIHDSLKERLASVSVFLFSQQNNYIGSLLSRENLVSACEHLSRFVFRMTTMQMCSKQLWLKEINNINGLCESKLN